ncbi:hypothetical protein GCM10007989_02010 [Devosia pacifica]|uniref:Uncharacterized protein n=1 Tax=Devosia pacifica TaxID=1335967 RepID=A0A918RWF1_9HYPH|nr:hypothetical protein GCM10007989_02010 [Devosia pacifica]
MALSADWFKAQYIKGARSGRSGNPLKVAPGTLIGSEVNADGYLACRYIAFRLGHLYQTLMGAVIEDKPMADLCGAEFMTSDGRLPKDAARIGRRRVVDALTLLSSAHEAWMDIAEGKAQPRSYAVGPLLNHMRPTQLSAANENARAKGKHYLLGAA